MIESVVIAGKQYNIAQAVAKEQKTLLKLVGALIAANSAAAQVEEIDIDFLKGALLVVGEERIDKIASIVLPRVFLSGSDTCVSIESFQGGMNALLEVLANAIKVNLADFFMWLDSVNKSARPAPQKSVTA